MQQILRQTPRRILETIPYWGVVALLAYMPFHIFLSQSLSLVTGGLPEWKLAKDVCIVVLVLFTLGLVWGRGSVPKWYVWLTGLTAGYAALHLLLWALHPQLYAQSAALSTTYNVRIPCFMLIGAGAAILQPKMFTFRSIFRIVLAVSTLVAALGVLQYFLPADTLAHLGYSLPRGVRPNFFIDDNPAFPRVMSTLRDPNSLGAYLLVPLAALTGLTLRIRRWKDGRSQMIIGALLLHLLALYLTFSRSAWLGTVVAIGMVIWWQYSSPLVRKLRRCWPMVLVLLVLAGALVFWQRHNSTVDGVLTHSTAAQVGPYDSNQLHWMYVWHGMVGIWREPWGHGPGTAGLASIQNPHGGLLTENYYVQIGYEVGVAGLVIFVVLNAWVYLRIWRRHDQWTPVLLASFWAYVLINMLLHMWSNEAVAAQWWLLAGIAMAVPVEIHKKGHKA
jgi:hypothetical protein